MFDSFNNRISVWIESGMPQDERSMLLHGITDDDIQMLQQRVLEAAEDKMLERGAFIFAQHLTVH